MSNDAASGHARARLRLDEATPVGIVRMGLVDYQEAWDLQQRLATERQRDTGRDLLLLLEHPAVYTLGKRTDPRHVLLDADERAARNIDLVEVDRGGDVTYHGPGQLVGYPILRLASIRQVVQYVRTLEEILIRSLAVFGVEAERAEGYTGVWVGDRKIAAIGVRVASKGVTSHGFALNVHPDLGDFTGIVPCGITDRGVCSLASLGIEVGVAEVADVVEQKVAEVFGATLEHLEARTLMPSM